MVAALYRTLTTLGTPLIRLYLQHRLTQGKEDADRLPERFGHASRPRPQGRLIWCHAASVGEAMSLLLLIDKLHAAIPDGVFLFTTGTVTAARMIAPRLPPYALHQFMPVDIDACVTRFLDHWRPDLAIWVESELWPNCLAALKARAIPMALLNARMSQKSFRHWYRVKGWARQMMAAITLCLAQTEDDRGRFLALGARPAKRVFNLKYASEPLPYDPAELDKMRNLIGDRPVWLMASTHRGEEELAMAAHHLLRRTYPKALTVIVPRHAVRGGEIERLIMQAGSTSARRSLGQALTADTAIYLADTMGELGLFYRLCPIVVLGGSFVPIGGHNPIEPAQLGGAIITGPHMHNFAGVMDEFLNARAVIQLPHANEIAFHIERLWANPAQRTDLAQAARFLAQQKAQVMDQVLQELQPLMMTLSSAVKT